MAKVKKSSGTTTCKYCLRSKDEAIKEQKQLGHVCDHDDCVFKREILEGLKELTKSQFCINCGKRFDAIEDLYCIFCGSKRL